MSSSSENIQRIINQCRNDQSHECIEYFSDLLLNDLKDEQGQFINCWIAGGAVRDYFFNNKVIRSDIDLYFPNVEELGKACAYFESKGLSRIKDNPRIIEYIYKDHKIQLIKIYNSTSEDTIKTFDFVCCMGVVDRNSLYTHEYFFDHNERKRLHFNSLNFPLKSLNRVQKYASYGYRMTRRQIIKLAKAMALVDVNDDSQTELSLYPDEADRIVFERVTSSWSNSLSNETRTAYEII